MGLKKFEDFLATDDWRKDYNKVKVIEKKHKAGSSVSFSCAYPTEENIKLAFGLLNDFVICLTTLAKAPETELDGLRGELLDISKILNGDLRDKKVLVLYRKYGLIKKCIKEGIFNSIVFESVFPLAILMNEIFIKASYLSQKLGFGSSIPYGKIPALDRI